MHIVGLLGSWSNACRGALPSFVCCRLLLDFIFDPAQCRQGGQGCLLGPSVLLARDGGQQYPDTPTTPLGTLRRAFFSFFFARGSLYISLRALYRASRQYSPIPKSSKKGQQKK